jgi:hypothetical protein
MKININATNYYKYDDEEFSVTNKAYLKNVIINRNFYKCVYVEHHEELDFHTFLVFYENLNIFENSVYDNENFIGLFDVNQIRNIKGHIIWNYTKEYWDVKNISTENDTKDYLLTYERRRKIEKLKKIIQTK